MKKFETVMPPGSSPCGPDSGMRRVNDGRRLTAIDCLIDQFRVFAKGLRYNEKMRLLPLFSLSRFMIVVALLMVSMGCAKKSQEPEVVALAANRKMGLAIKINNQSTIASDELMEVFSTLVSEGLQKAYGAKAVVVSLDLEGPLETPANYYQLGRGEFDDLFIVDLQVPSGFQITGSASPEAPSDAAAETTDEGSSVEASSTSSIGEASVLKTSIYSGANLKAINIFNTSVPSGSPEQIKEQGKQRFAEGALKVFANPNIYPKSDPKHFAGLLFVFSENYAKGFTEALTCENAPKRLMYYKWANELYSIANARGSTKVVGLQQEASYLQQRLQDSAEKSKVIDQCLNDSQATFDMKVDYGTLPAESQLMIQKAIDKADLLPLLRQYTSKPVTLRLSVQESGYYLDVDLRFDRRRYQAWTVQRIPPRIKNMQVLSLDPYYALMQKFVILRTLMPEDAPFQLRSAFATMKMVLHLTTILNGEVSLPMDGRYIRDAGIVKLAYPSAIQIASPGSETKTIPNRDAEIFQAHGFIALGNCKLLDGKMTEDGLVYEFFGFPCQ